MSECKLAAKEAYFDEHALLNLEDDDDDDVPNKSLQNLQNALEETRPKVRKPTGSFLGPTPKEQQAEFEAYAKRQAGWEAFTKKRRGTKRQTSQDPVLPSTAPEPELAKSFPATKPRSGLAAKGKGKLKRASSLTEVPFWKQVGVVPRELKHRKAKPAQDIELYPPHKQLFKDKIVYFYPNDDISVARRRRIHKVIQLGAAWVTSWRDDITHIIIDDATYKCKYMMERLNRTYIPEHIVLVIFDPYVPDSIQFEESIPSTLPEAKALAHLPLDEDEDADSLLASGIDDAEDSGTDEEPLVALKPTKLSNILSRSSALRDKKVINMNTFQCMDPGANGYNSQNPNARTIQILEEMCKHYDQMQDHWRTLSYRKCINTLKKQTVKITTAEQAIALPFIGTRLADKIEEIVLTVRLRRLDSTRDDPLDKILRLFLGIYGAGLSQANKWIQTGYRTLSDLETKAKLTPSQKVGLEHYTDFNSRIPRAEVEVHGAVVIAALKKIDPKFKATIMGSYRRGAKDSGDIDMIITCPDTPLAAMRTTVFEVLVPHLYKTGFLKASLATSRSNDPAGSKWHGASCLPELTVWRRMDLLLVPEEEMGAALIYFTGNDIFNRSMRLLARKMNMRLNQRGLYKDVKREARGEKLNEGVLVEGRNEKKIFETLGVPWREPHERIC
ncbi:DNA polymerase lambda [Pyrenophora tritici-repentis Pt-1C-BFP]|uniref:DNA polymerase n=1 Tax=Pyrenophora tritici-repentis (strain Pt-1C-BFP) TaxID=426418 RepID=B2VQK6_PYRTR|nr:DNA polymerase lambda [Pyrenophora tritici-repentis Pt-1C-BFP]EDU39906.1 DNA polymerase lambda [Pyrenophora tritici-repentis Pt-1C-BFP]